MLGLRCCLQAFLVAASGGCSLAPVASRHGARAPWGAGLRSCGTWPACLLACGILQTGSRVHVPHAGSGFLFTAPPGSPWNGGSCALSRKSVALAQGFRVWECCLMLGSLPTPVFSAIAPVAQNQPWRRIYTMEIHKCFKLGLALLIF